MMKVLIHITVNDICEYVWDSVSGEIKAGYYNEFSEPNFNFTYDENGVVTGMDIDTTVEK